MVHLVLRIVLLVLLLVVHLHLSYDFNQGWWHSAAATPILALCGWLIWRERAPAVGGLIIPRKELVPVISVTVISLVLSALVMFWLAGDRVEIGHSSFRHYAHIFFYVLNEEVVLGAMLLYFINARLGLRPVFAALALALVLALGHLAFYKWYFRDHGLLSATAVISLFFVAFAKNHLIVRNHHIGFAWALHFGWMLVMYGCTHAFAHSGTPLTDLEKFNLYLGSPVTAFLSGALALGVALVPASGRLARAGER